MKLIDAEIDRKRIRAPGWPKYLCSFFGAYVLFAAVSHTFWPHHSPEAAGLVLYSPSKIIFYYMLGYFVFFLSIHLVLALPIIGAAKAIPKHRSAAVSLLLFRVLGPTWLVALIAKYYAWYGDQVLGPAFR